MSNGLHSNLAVQNIINMVYLSNLFDTILEMRKLQQRKNRVEIKAGHPYFIPG
jgi:hypothetical protein